MNLWNHLWTSFKSVPLLVGRSNWYVWVALAHGLYKHTDDSVSDDFPKISDHFLKLSQDFQKLFWRPADKHSRTFSENFRRLPKTFEEDRKMFRWYTNEFKYYTRDKLDISDIFTCEDIVSFLSICYHSVYHWLLYNKITNKYETERKIKKNNCLEKNDI